MKQRLFDRAEHVYRNDAFAELVKDAVRFFNGTPVLPLPPPVSFQGRGVYAIYYIGSNPLYARYAMLNHTAYEFPIYVGKAVPKGWRQSRTSDDAKNQSSELFSRLRQHHGSLKLAPILRTDDFMCRFVIFEDTGSDMISTVEAALIKLNRPLWNTAVDGFGNHDPGKGRYEQARSDWDVIHPGRKWADKCNGVHKTKAVILAKIKTHLALLGKSK
jgi:Eco29kI restriction endonuclease